MSETKCPNCGNILEFVARRDDEFAEMDCPQCGLLCLVGRLPDCSECGTALEFILRRENDLQEFKCSNCNQHFLAAGPVDATDQNGEPMYVWATAKLRKADEEI